MHPSNEATLLPRHLSRQQWYTYPFVNMLATSETLGWENVTLCSTELNAKLDYDNRLALEDDVLVFTREGSTQLEGRIGKRIFKQHMIPGTIMLIPRHTESNGGWPTPISVDFFHLSRFVISETATFTHRGDPEHLELLPLLGIHDPLLRPLCTALYHELQNESLFGSLFAESIANTIIIHLLQNYSNFSTLQKISGGKLTTLQFRIVDEYIQAHLHEKISLANLANSICLSVPHFEKMFRATLHCAPYHFVLEQRIERAKQLLSGAYLSLFDVALDCGFANQSHFTKHFTKFVGVSPIQFVRGLKS